MHNEFTILEHKYFKLNIKRPNFIYNMYNMYDKVYQILLELFQLFFREKFFYFKKTLSYNLCIQISN